MSAVVSELVAELRICQQLIDMQREIADVARPREKSSYAIYDHVAHRRNIAPYNWFPIAPRFGVNASEALLF